MSKIFDSKSFLKKLTNQPGIYCMYDAYNKIIYIGKAKNLKKRISSYFLSKKLSLKTKIMVKLIKNIEVLTTNTEKEALILEHNYIKNYKPKYNVLFRYDKSYPFILISNDKHPRIEISRIIHKNNKDQYFGPFPYGNKLRTMIAFLQKTFLIRLCKDNVYNNRSRPCLEYQINRCLGPCIKGLVSDNEYMKQVEYMRMFLAGKDEQVINKLVINMEEASNNLNFEKAAKIRDQIKIIRLFKEKQYIYTNNKNVNNLDILSIAFTAGIACIYILFVRYGRVIGSNNYYPKVPEHTEIDEVIETFIGQFYLKNIQNNGLPDEIVIDYNIKNKCLLSSIISDIIGKKIKLRSNPSGYRAQYLKIANKNAVMSLTSILSKRNIINKNLKELAILLNLSKIKRLECFDISHTMGEETIASCIVFDSNGPLYKEYRCYNIDNIKPGDDYAAINQALFKHYNRYIENDKIPDVIIIDGGKGQLNEAKMVFSKLEVSWNKHHPLIISIAKGKNRREKMDVIFLKPDNNGLHLPSYSKALHIIQYIRNESHSYAINNHRKRFSKVRNINQLETIKGIGKKRRYMLLKHMGGLQGLINASIEEIAKVPTISKYLAEKVFYSLKH